MKRTTKQKVMSLCKIGVTREFLSKSEFEEIELFFKDIFSKCAKNYGRYPDTANVIKNAGIPNDADIIQISPITAVDVSIKFFVLIPLYNIHSDGIAEIPIREAQFKIKNMFEPSIYLQNDRK